MRIYLDDDVASAVLASLLRRAGHDTRLPADVGLSGEDDAVHLTQAIRESRALISGNHDDFEKLHYLVVESGGHHPGILIVRRDNDLRRDLSPRGIVAAVRNLEASNVPMADSFYVLNRWR
jgi:hypothetical protein